MQKGNVKYYVYLFLTIVVISVYSCSSPMAEYNKLVKQELATGKRYDSLFLGLYMGMPRKDFYAHCWKLNKQGLLIDAQGATMVQYKINSLKYPAAMDFYPDFYKEKIYHMRADFQYNAWAPWNRAQFADSLITDLLQLYKRWYPGGNGFMKMTDPKKGTIYVKVDGNRRIIMGVNTEMIVKVDYTDLLIEEQLKKVNKKDGGLK